MHSNKYLVKDPKSSLVTKLTDPVCYPLLLGILCVVLQSLKGFQLSLELLVVFSTYTTCLICKDPVNVHEHVHTRSFVTLCITHLVLYNMLNTHH